MKVIVNCDDFGYCEDTVRATIECLERGYASSATIMANMPGTESAIRYALANPQWSYGVHLTFSTDTIERPVTPVEQIPGISRVSGAFLRPFEVRFLALQGTLPVDEIAIEMAAQIGVLLNHGLKVSHVDSHGHLHKYKTFRLAMERVLPKFGISRVRNVQDIYMNRPILSPTYWIGSMWRKRLMASYLSTDHFYMGTTAKDRADSCANLLRPLMSDSGSIEIGIHPGYTENWRSDEMKGAQITARYLQSVHRPLATWNEINAA